MKRAFPLAGLLRLRHLQQDSAAGDLAAAHVLAQENDTRRMRARVALGGTPSAATSTEALHAMAAARASTRSMLADLDALGQDHRATVADAQSTFDAARAESRGLEKLEDRHAASVTAEGLHAEQTVLDEIAATRWHREQNSDRGGVSP